MREYSWKPEGWHHLVIAFCFIGAIAMVMIAMAKRDIHLRAIDRLDDLCYDHCYPFVHDLEEGACWCADLGQDAGDPMHPEDW